MRMVPIITDGVGTYIDETPRDLLKDEFTF